MTGDVSRETPAIVRTLYPTAEAGLAAYAELLAGDGTVRGLIGPREVPRLWDRHLLNCALVERLIPAGSTVADIGTGAGLPGIVLALVRPDLEISLVEPLLRRTTFLEQAVEQLGITNATVVRARAEELAPAGFDVVTSRAVAPLAKLAAWCLPLCGAGGLMLALKGSSAAEELASAERALRSLGAEEWQLHELGVGELVQPTTVVSIVAGRAAGPRKYRAARHGQRGR